MSATLPSDALSLLPSNSTALERELAALSSSLDTIDPAVISTLWDAWRIPTPLLPWLAWALSVDFWDDSWPEVTRRQVCADSPAYHRLKGTRRAVEMALGYAGRAWTLTEWFDAVPRRRHGTASAHIVTEDYAEIAVILNRVRPLVMASKPKSRSVSVNAGPRIEGVFVVGAGILDETLTVVSAYAYTGDNAQGAFVLAAGILTEEFTRIEAQ
jgi:phage tail P2-like protein